MNDITKVLDLESQIRSEIGKDSQHSLNFQYHKLNQIGPEGHISAGLKVFTFNPVTKEHFLLMSVTGKDEIGALENVLSYVRSHKSEMNSYTVIWAKKAEGTRNKSYFYCDNLLSLSQKFYEGKDPSAYIIYEVTLNPIA